MRIHLPLALVFAYILGAGCAGKSGGIPSAMLCYGEWNAVGPWGGGYVQNVVFCPNDPSRCYAYIDCCGLYRSDDAGETWHALHGALPLSGVLVRGVNVDPRDADRFVVAIGDYPTKWEGLFGLYLTEDGGKSFRRVLATDGFDSNGHFRMAGLTLARSPSNPNTVMAASIIEGVWVSHDNGETWSSSGAKGLWPTDLRFDQCDAKRLWLCSPAWTSGVYKDMPLVSPYEAGFFRSDDGGKSWRKLADESPTEILQDPSDASRLLGIFDERLVKLSRDGGESWGSFSTGLPVAATLGGAAACWSKSRFCALAAGPDFFLSANADGDFFRVDKGQDTWRPVVRKDIDRNGWWAPLEESNWSCFGKALGSIVVDPRDPAHWLFTDWFCVWQTHDYGASWKPTTKGMAQTCGLTLVSDPFDPKVLHMGMFDNAYFRSDNGGSSFKRPNPPLNGDRTCIAPALSEPKLIYSCGGYLTSCDVSHDGGLTWSRLACKGLPKMVREEIGLCSLAVAPQDAKRLYACVSGAPKPNGGGVYESADGGDSWSWKGGGLPPGKGPRGLFAKGRGDSAGRHEIACSKDGSLVCVSRGTNQIYYWDKGATAWKTAKAPDAPIEVAADPFAAGRFLVAANHSLLLSEDGGKTWSTILDLKPLQDVIYPGGKWLMAGRVAFDPRKRGRMAACVHHGVLLSEDGGKTWGLLDGGIPDQDYERCPAFLGDKLFVQSRLSGTFWLDLAMAKATPLTQ